MPGSGLLPFFCTLCSAWIYNLGKQKIQQKRQKQTKNMENGFNPPERRALGQRQLLKTTVGSICQPCSAWAQQQLGWQGVHGYVTASQIMHEENIYILSSLYQYMQGTSQLASLLQFCNPFPEVGAFHSGECLKKLSLQNRSPIPPNITPMPTPTRDCTILIL